MVRDPLVNTSRTVYRTSTESKTPQARNTIRENWTEFQFLVFHLNPKQNGQAKLTLFLDGMMGIMIDNGEIWCILSVLVMVYITEELPYSIWKGFSTPQQAATPRKKQALHPAKLTKSAWRSGAKLTDSIDTPFHFAHK